MICEIKYEEKCYFFKQKEEESVNIMYFYVQKGKNGIPALFTHKKYYVIVTYVQEKGYVIS